MRSLLVSILCLLVLFPVWSQSNADRAKRKVQILTRAQQSAIAIRIAPTDPTLWKLGNKYGYFLERFTVTRNGAILKNRERTLLTKTPLMPKPVAEWEKPADNNDLIAIAAQAIYGETFELDTKSISALEVYNKTQETESRFSFALLAADFSAETAQLSGLYYRDTNVNKGEKYLYRVYANIPQNILAVDTGFVYVGLEDYADLPKPTEVFAQFGDRTAAIRWDTRYLKDSYTAYWVERSDDGASFRKISPLPSLTTFEGDAPNTTFYYQLDSLPQNKTTYYYRIIGVNAFGEEGPPSDIIEGAGSKSLAANPAIMNGIIIGNQVKIEWDFPKTDEDAVKGFKVERAAKANSGYKFISDELTPKTRIFIDKNPMATNYYRIRAIGLNGEESVSFPYLRQLEDSIPPVSPTGLKGSIDTTGIVTLAWNKNKEPDLLGYRVYRSNFKNAEFSQVTASAISTETYIEKISLNNLSSKMYYKIQAIDNRFNPSNFSQIIEIEKPDRIPPVPPVVKNYQVSSTGITLQWINSSSEDVAQHIIYRRKAGEINWQTLKVIPDGDTTQVYTDTPPGNIYYEYALSAFDKNNLESKLTTPVKGRVLFKSLPPIEKIKSNIDREKKTITLTWNYDQKEIDKIIIYRAEGNESPSMYQSLKGDQKIFVDEKLNMNMTYAYYLKVVLRNGVESEFSRKIEVRY